MLPGPYILDDLRLNLALGQISKLSI
jgi:hypothetical protein